MKSALDLVSLASILSKICVEKKSPPCLTRTTPDWHLPRWPRENQCLIIVHREPAFQEGYGCGGYESICISGLSFSKSRTPAHCPDRLCEAQKCCKKSQSPCSLWRYAFLRWPPPTTRQLILSGEDRPTMPALTSGRPRTSTMTPSRTFSTTTSKLRVC